MRLPSVRLRSVRARLVVGNVAALALLLTGLGVGMWYWAQARLLGVVDRDLARQTKVWERRPRMPGPPPGARFDPWVLFWVVNPMPMRFEAPSPPPPRDPPDINRPRMLDMAGNAPPDGGWPGPFDPKTFARSIRGEAAFSTRKLNGQTARIHSRPLREEDTIVGAVQWARSIEPELAELRRLRQLLLTLLPVALAAAAVGGILVTARAMRPIRTLTDAANRIGAASLSARLPAEGRDEFSDLAGTINAMLARIESAFERQRRFAADASHELRTPLAAIKAEVGRTLAQDTRSSSEYRQTLADVNTAANRMAQLVEDLLLLARSEDGRLPLDLEVLDVTDVLLSAASSLPDGAGPTIDISTTRPVSVVGDDIHLQRLFVNLLDNARRHTPPSGSIACTAQVDGDAVVVAVTDTGEGIDPVHLPHVLEGFYRADAARTRARGGAGLGLAIAKTIVEAHKGTISIESTLGTGTEVTVRMPSARLGSSDLAP